MYKSLYTLSNSIKYIYLIFILILFISCSEEKSSKETLEIFAAASTQEILEEINISFSKENNINIQMNLGGSNNLTSSIIRGATPDIIISAGELPIENIVNKGLIERENIISLWSNSLVIIHHSNKEQKISIKSILLNSKRIGIADPSLAPAGYYAKETLNQLINIQEIQKKLVYGTNVRTTLAHFATKHVDTALVYNSDAIAFSPKESTIIILPIPRSLTPPIIYSTGILESSQHKDIANKYITYLKNNSSKILETKGFTPIKSTIE